MLTYINKSSYYKFYTNAYSLTHKNMYTHFSILVVNVYFASTKQKNKNKRKNKKISNNHNIINYLKYFSMKIKIS